MNLLPEGLAELLAARLEARPGVMTIGRDRHGLTPGRLGMNSRCDSSSNWRTSVEGITGTRASPRTEGE